MIQGEYRHYLGHQMDVSKDGEMPSSFCGLYSHDRKMALNSLGNGLCARA